MVDQHIHTATTNNGHFFLNLYITIRQHFPHKVKHTWIFILKGHFDDDVFTCPYVQTDRQYKNAYKLQFIVFDKPSVLSNVELDADFLPPESSLAEATAQISLSVPWSSSH